MSKWTVELCQKKDLYNKIIEAFKSKGWEDIASAPATEFNVLRSYDDEERPIFIRLQPQTPTGGPSHNVITTDRTAFVIGVARNYTPNANAGTAGVFDTFTTQSVAFNGTNLTTSSTQIHLETDNIKLYHNITNKRGYFAVRFNSNNSYSTTLGSVFFAGVPDEEFMDDNPARATFYFGSGYGSIVGLDYPKQFSAALMGSVVYTGQGFVSARTPDVENKFWASPVFYNHANVGIRGRFSNMLYLPDSTTRILDGDIICVDGVNYELLRISAVTAVMPANAFVCMEI